jgi:hypothetical protein
MDVDAPNLCKLCGGLMNFIVRISLPRQALFQCDGCREFAWISDEADADDDDQA